MLSIHQIEKKDRATILTMSTRTSHKENEHLSDDLDEAYRPYSERKTNDTLIQTTMYRA